MISQVRRYASWHDPREDSDDEEDLMMTGEGSRTGTMFVYVALVGVFVECALVLVFERAL